MLRFEARGVHYIPAQLEPGLIYVSDEYGVAVHLCACGCGDKVVTPLGETDWELTEETDGPTLWPSVGNWQSPCQAHYVIRRGRVLWERRWTADEIAAGRRAEERHYHAYSAIRERRGHGLGARLRRFIARVLGR